METTTILLLVALVVLIYAAFFIFSRTTTIVDKIDLAKPNTPITADTLKNAGSGVYSYSMWIYVYAAKESLRENPQNYFMKRAASDTKSNIEISLDGTTPQLHIKYVANKLDADGKPTTDLEQKSILVTDDFPLQTWVNLVVSVQNSYIDIYMNGKLVKSVKDDKISTPSSESPIQFGQFGAYLVKFNHIDSATDPQTAWSNYLAGNGESLMAKYTGNNYGMDVNFKSGSGSYNVQLL